MPSHDPVDVYSVVETIDDEEVPNDSDETPKLGMVESHKDGFDDSPRDKDGIDEEEAGDNPDSDLGNSDVLGMQCFCSVVSKMVSGMLRNQFRKQSCKNAASPKHLNYRGLILIWVKQQNIFGLPHPIVVSHLKKLFEKCSKKPHYVLKLHP